MTDAASSATVSPDPILTDATTASVPAAVRGLAAGSDLGISTTDGVTSVARPVIVGTGTADATVQVFDDANANGRLDAGESLGSVVVGTGGQWSVTPAQPLKVGTHRLRVQQGTVSGSVSDPFVVLVDTTRPGAPFAQALVAGSDTGVLATDRLTNDATPTLGGRGEKGATVTLFVDTSGNGLFDAGESVGSGIIGDDGIWRVTTSTLADGTVALRAVQTDQAGNVSAAGAPLALRIDTTADSAPVLNGLTAATDSGIAANDAITRIVRPVITGTAEAGGSVRILEGEAVLATAVVAASGKWTVTLPTAFADGAHLLTVRNVDKAGNVSDASTPLQVFVDTTPEAAPAGVDLLTGSDSGSLATDDVTRSTQPEFAGDAGPSCRGMRIQLFRDANGNGTMEAAEALASAIVASDGKWTVAPTTPMAAGVHAVRAVLVDVAGNVSAASATLRVTIDNKVPAAPSALKLAAGSDTGISAADRLTADATPIVSGRGEKGAVVTLFADRDADGLVDDGESLGTATVGDAGAWTITCGQLADGVVSMRSRQVDLAGNVSVASAALAVTIDTVPSGAAAVTLMSDSGASASDRVSTNGLVGVASIETGATWQYSVDAGATWAKGAGTAFKLSAKTYAPGDVRVKVMDKAGNERMAMLADGCTIDTTRPVVGAATLSGTRLSFTLDEAIDTAHLPVAGAFSVRAGSKAIAVSAVESGGSGVVALTLADAVTAGTQVVLGYKDPTAGDDAGALQDLAGNDVATFAGKVVQILSAGQSIEGDNDNNLSTARDYDASGGDVRFAEDANLANTVRILNFARGDRIELSHADTSKYAFTSYDGNVVIYYNNTDIGAVSRITLVGVAGNGFIQDEGSAERALGYDFFGHA